MKVFASNFLESFKETKVKNIEDWKWQPENTEIKELYCSGSPSKTRCSTYTAEKDSQNDTGRPNEGG